MYSVENLYCLFLKKKGEASKRGYRAPKDFEKKFSEMAPDQRESWRKLSGYFNTTWQNIDPEKYFQYGFELWKTFFYKQFFDQKLINYYIQKDKNQKRELELNKKSVILSAKFVKLFMKENKISNLKLYAWKKDGYHSVCVKHYIQGKIDKMFLSYLIMRRYLVLSDEEKRDIPYVIETFRDSVSQISKIREFFYKIEDSLDLGGKAMTTKTEGEMLDKNDIPEGQTIICGDETKEEKEKKKKQYIDENLNEKVEEVL